MCNSECLRFAQVTLDPNDIRGKDVLEVGSCNVNGSVRDVVSPWEPASYTGVDIAAGPGVDLVCDVGDLVLRFGRDRFDAVVCTEVLEHVRDWRAAIRNLKQVLKDNGVLLLTTRSRGFPYHGYPSDFWRYEPCDLESIFADFRIKCIESDPSCPGVFMTARKRGRPVPLCLDGLALYSILARRRCTRLSALEEALGRSGLALCRILPPRLKTAINGALPGSARKGCAIGGAAARRRESNARGERIVS